ncbi:unnamed protein product [Penicillium salamii]|uniref:Uncharacterized protein n=1 Tax=Penicillium salamii TaxID=1612424 RepID=A0A9W4JQJ2_9EURO|nr:unnamed protein product [Penicillium salamii]
MTARSHTKILNTPYSTATQTPSFETTCNQVESIFKAFVPQEERSSIYQVHPTPQICGAWIGVLPKLLQGPDSRDKKVLSLAIETLFAGITKKPCEQTIQTYAAAIDAVRMIENSEPLNPLLAAAIMCLTLAELMLPDSRSGFAMHVNGIARLFQANDSSRFTSGVLQGLFDGYRPLFMLQALQSRKETFIAMDEWIRIPFTNREVSSMQSLISEASSLPSILQQTDQILASDKPSLNEVLEPCKKYIELLSRIQTWETSLQFDLRNIQRLPQSNPTEVHPSLRIKFPNITLANVYTQLWSYRIICALELMDLVSRFPEMDLPLYLPGCSLSVRDVGELTENHAVKICCGIEYLVRDDMGLYGPASTLLPLQMAYRVFGMDRLRNATYITFIEGVVRHLVEKGLQCAPYLVYGK